MQLAVSEEQFGRDMLAAAIAEGHVAKLPVMGGAVAKPKAKPKRRLITQKQMVVTSLQNGASTSEEICSDCRMTQQRAAQLLSNLVSEGRVAKIGQTFSQSNRPLNTFKLLEAG